MSSDPLDLDTLIARMQTPEAMAAARALFDSLTRDRDEHESALIDVLAERDAVTQALVRVTGERDELRERLALTQPTKCDECGHGCLDYASRGGKRLCVGCVEDQRDAAREELAKVEKALWSVGSEEHRAKRLARDLDEDLTAARAEAARYREALEHIGERASWAFTDLNSKHVKEILAMALEARAALEPATPAPAEVKDRGGYLEVDRDAAVAANIDALRTMTRPGNVAPATTPAEPTTGQKIEWLAEGKKPYVALADFEELRREVEATAQVADRQRERAKAAERERDQLRADLDHVRQELNDSEYMLSQARARAEAAERERDEWKTQAAMVREELDKLKLDFEGVRAERGQLRAALVQAVESIRGAQKTVINSLAEIVRMGLPDGVKVKGYGDRELIDREQVVQQAMRIRQASDSLHPALAAAERALGGGK